MDQIRSLKNLQIWISRLLIGAVLFLNFQCAVIFLLWPEAFSGSFELSGVGGRVMVQGMGVLFLMWNVPYVVAIIDPLKKITSLAEAVSMQTIGLVGESLLFVTLPAGHHALRMSAMRFIGFDGGGLVLLAIGLVIMQRYKRNQLNL
jgi:hypothetical protein